MVYVTMKGVLVGTVVTTSVSPSTETLDVMLITVGGSVLDMSVAVAPARACLEGGSR